MTELVLSIFPGVGLLDRAFRHEGFWVVQHPDKITGGDVRDCTGVPGRIDGIVAGSPCQGFSGLNRHRKKDDHHSTVNSWQMLQETCRIVCECQPDWFLVENVPSVPDVRIDGYTVQRIPITDRQCGGVQQRSRHIQFGSLHGEVIRPKRVNDSTSIDEDEDVVPAVTTKRERRVSYPEVCRRQGLDSVIDLLGWYQTAKVRAVGNGVPIRMGRVLAAAVVCRAPRDAAADCPCGCGRVISGKQITASVSCRKRKQLSVQPRAWVDVKGYHKPSQDLQLNRR